MEKIIFCKVDQIDVCRPIIDTLLSNSIEYVWQVMLLSDEQLTALVGKFDMNLIRFDLLINGANKDLKMVKNNLDEFLSQPITKIPEIALMIQVGLRGRQLRFIYNHKNAAFLPAKNVLIKKIESELQRI